MKSSVYSPISASIFWLSRRGAEGGDDQRLGFAAGEQGRTVGTRQDAGADRDRTHGAGVAAVDARLAVQDLRTHDLGFHVEQDVADFDESGAGWPTALLGGQAGHDFAGQRLQLLLARRFSRVW
jgi:hypothetical protein